MKIPASPPMVGEILAQLESNRLAAVLTHDQIGPVPKGRYYHWEDLRRRTPPEGLSREEWWLGIKVSRLHVAKTLPFTDKEGRRISYVLTDEALSILHQIDQQAAGQIRMPEVVTNSATRDRYIVAGLMEEAISSSLLENAATTRRDAKKLLRSGRKPRTKSERMVVNNYLTMQHIGRDLDAPLTVEMVQDIHRMVTEHTLDQPEDAGRIQHSGERRVDVGDDYSEIPLHKPPPASELPSRLESLVDFANDTGGGTFVHPVVRAIALHFYLAYIHPFVDGNGRTARALFYRSLLRRGYWLAEFFSISRLLYQAPAQYARSFLYTETDESDFTYFLLCQLQVLRRAIAELLEDLERKVSEVRQVERVLHSDPGLNHRQIALLGHTLRNPYSLYTIREHQASHRVTYETARTDLTGLKERGFLTMRKSGKENRFFPAVEALEEGLGT